MSEISETQSNLDELMNEYEVAVIGENRGRNRSGYSEKADKYYQKRRELKEFVAELEAEIERLTAHSDIERQDDKCSGHGDISNFPPVMGSGDGLGW